MYKCVSPGDGTTKTIQAPWKTDWDEELGRIQDLKWNPLSNPSLTMKCFSGLWPLFDQDHSLIKDIVFKNASLKPRIDTGMATSNETGYIQILA